MTENARKEVVKNYNWSLIAENTLNTYKQVIVNTTKEKSNIVSMKEIEEKLKEQKTNKVQDNVTDENDITSSLIKDVTKLLKFNDRNKLFNM
jgi:hypothetical protein